jgi:hypothetical protein
MFEKILIADRGDQPPLGGVAAKPNRTMAAGQQGDLTPETLSV